MMEKLSERAIDIVNELHTERLDYHSEYVPLMYALNHLAEYEDAEADGRLRILPYKIGQTLWDATVRGADGKEYCEARIVGIFCYEEDLFALCLSYKDVSGYSQELLGAVGNTLFHTKEEAEDAIREGRVNEDWEKEALKKWTG